MRFRITFWRIPALKCLSNNQIHPFTLRRSRHSGSDPDPERCPLVTLCLIRTPVSALALQIKAVSA
jgi:hypothetical protein